jgi:uncharacterized protein YndB with AHSA1/START domain
MRTRREFSVGLAAAVPALAMAKNAFAAPAPQGDRNGISHAAESIHQEVEFGAARKRVYEALTDEKQFRQVTDFVMKGAATQISPEVGGTFTIFGDVISGRHIELVPYERVVQAWREKYWDAGVYSIVRFQLNEQAGGTKLIFDHTGFPAGASASLAPGWWSHYWEPMKKYFG